MLGTLILWFGWYGFNAGSALLTESSSSMELVALAAANTTLAGGAGGIVALFGHLWWMERTTGEIFFELKYAMNGSLSGLVAITGGCGVVEPWAAVLIGALSGVVYLLSSSFLLRIRLDDAVDAIPVHMFNGLWGLLAVGLFASPTRLDQAYPYGRSDHPGLFYSWHQGRSDATLLGAQIVGALFILGWVMVIMLPFFVWLDWKGWFRSDPLEELVGLDTSYHGGLALLAQEGDDSVHPEYISAFKRRRSETSTLRLRKKASQRTMDVAEGAGFHHPDSHYLEEDHEESKDFQFHGPIGEYPLELREESRSIPHHFEVHLPRQYAPDPLPSSPPPPSRMEPEDDFTQVSI